MHVHVGRCAAQLIQLVPPCRLCNSCKFVDTCVDPSERRTESLRGDNRKQRASTQNGEQHTSCPAAAAPAQAPAIACSRASTIARLSSSPASCSSRATPSCSFSPTSSTISCSTSLYASARLLLLRSDAVASSTRTRSRIDASSARRCVSSAARFACKRATTRLRRAFCDARRVRRAHDWRKNG